MTDNELKKILHEQFEPLDTAVQKKLEYLNSDDVFSYDDNSYEYSMKDGQELSINDAFSTFSSAQSNTEYERPLGLNKVTSKSVNSIQFEQSTPETINSHKQNIAAKIAALRGISLPGDYLKK